VEARLEALGAGEQRPAELQRREGPGVEPRAELGGPRPGGIAHWVALGGGGGAPPSRRAAPGPPASGPRPPPGAPDPPTALIGRGAARRTAEWLTPRARGRDRRPRGPVAAGGTPPARS